MMSQGQVTGQINQTSNSSKAEDNGPGAASSSTASKETLKKWFINMNFSTILVFL